MREQQQRRLSVLLSHGASAAREPDACLRAPPFRPLQALERRR